MAIATLHAAPSSPHAGRIEFGPSSRRRHGWAGAITVVYDGQEWAVEVDMIDAYVADMVGFFEQLARRSAASVEPWRSEFGEIVLTPATVNRDVIALRFWLSWGEDELADEPEGELHVPRRALPHFAADIRELTGMQGRA